MSNIDKHAVQAVADLKAGYTLGHADVATLNELARIALASLEAEPVAWLLSGGGAKNNVSFDSGNAYADPLREVTPLYTATPAPVSVPAAMEMDDDFDSAFEHGKAVGWNAYRAAMLQSFGNSEQLNSPVIPDGLRLALSNAGIAAPESDEMLAATCEKYFQELVTWVKDRKPFRSAAIPDGWVACSERMPEIGIKVLCFPVNDEPIHATYNGQVWLQDISWSASDEPIDNVISCNVFHWMPLPAAPQQEVK
ncbi:DUF551 domain-containing protein [Enterobacter phage BUCT554]|nr:DUF551 domain-containing protein [Enterobacter phage BUCT554]